MQIDNTNGRRFRNWLAGLIGAGALAAAVSSGALTRVDLLIEGGMVADGSGAPLRRADVAVSNRRIVGVGRWRYRLARATRRLDAAGRVVSPGFIDVHTHVEPNIPSSSAFRPANFLRQGVTTLITGNCGRSEASVGRLLTSIDRHGTYANLATLIGHNTVRGEVMGNAARAATPAETHAMVRSVERAMKDGALGLSYGRPYLPGRFAEKAELVALAKSIVPSDGVAAWHIRDEGLHGIESLGEALDVGRATHVRTHISHFKSSGPSQWQHLPDRLALVARARTDGVDVTIDAYPYDRSSTTTDVLLPDWALSDNRSGVRAAQRDKSINRKLVLDISALAAGAGWHDFRFVTIVSGHRDWIGRTLADLADAPPGRDVEILQEQARVLIDISARGGAQAVFADMAESDVTLAIADDEAAFGSDSAVRDPDTTRPVHPRGLGTFPRVFRKYVRETATLTIENAVRKASALAADIFGLADRGRITQGAWADIVVFDPTRITDRATYEEPLSEPDGIDYVIVNGTVVVDHGSFTREPPAGMAVRRSRPSSGPSLTRRIAVRVRAWVATVWRLHS